MVTNRVFKVLVTNGVQMANMADTDAGQYLIIDSTGTTVSSTTALTGDDVVQIVVNDTAGVKVYSDPIRVKDIKAYNREDFRAKVEQVVTLTPSTPVVGNIYSVSIIDNSDKEILQMRQSKKVYEAIAATTTASDLVTLLKAKINADPNAIVVATGTSTLILTAKAIASTANVIGEFPLQYTFSVQTSTQPSQPTSPSYTLTAGGTVAATTAADYGCGNFWQIRTLEQRGLGYTGLTNRTKFPAPTPNYLSVSGVEYDVAVLEHDNTHDTNIVTVGKFEAPISTIIAVTKDAGDSTIFPILLNIVDSVGTQLAAIDARLDAIPA